MHTSSHMIELELLTSMGREKKLSCTHLFGKMSFAPGITSGVSVGFFSSVFQFHTVSQSQTFSV